ncbi:MAG TPA: T9SS type A sorting domain-containing protein [Chitinophagaceae bacterium]|nr:T9SS type A sorting domain-containing protein [Chitinophagaceae bacterium]
MKNCFFSLLMTMLCTSVSAQRYCDLEVTGGVTGTTIHIDPAGATPTYFDISFRNNGADTLKETDTVYFFSDLLTGRGHAYISPVILDPGGEINIKDTFYFETGPAEGNYKFCDSVWATSMASDLAIDTVVLNNKNCQTLKVVYKKPTAIGDQMPGPVTEKANSLGIRPNPASLSVELDFIARNNEAVRAEVYDVSGRLVLSHSYDPSFNGQSGYTLDVRSLQPGAYFVSMKQEGLQVNGKLIKQ